MSEWVEVGKKKYLITQPATPIELGTIKVASAKKYITAAQGGGFTVNASVSIASEKGDMFASGPRAGQERPEKSVTHLWISASALAGTRTVAAFLLHFRDGRWGEAKVWDVAGWPTEGRADYSINKNEAKSLGISEQEAQERGDRLDAQYNTGETYINYQARWLATALDFEEWLADLVPSFTAKARPIKKTQPEGDNGLELIREGEWIA